MPWMWIVAGPNGAGKSTLAAEFLENRGISGLLKLNADEVTASLKANGRPGSQNEINLAAAQWVDAEVERCIRDRTNFLVETVLSSGKYRDDVLAAKTAGFNVGMMFVSLHPPELSPERVAQRVLRGGHHVDPERAIARYHRSHEEFAWFAVHADMLFAVDNSSPITGPVLLVEKYESVFCQLPGVNPAVDRAMAAAFPERAPAGSSRL